MYVVCEAIKGLPLREDLMLPFGVTDRAADVWEALLSIAQASGGRWSALAHDACVQFVHAVRYTQPGRRTRARALREGGWGRRQIRATSPSDSQ